MINKQMQLTIFFVISCTPFKFDLNEWYSSILEFKFFNAILTEKTNNKILIILNISGLKLYANNEIAYRIVHKDAVI